MSNCKHPECNTTKSGCLYNTSAFERQSDPQNGDTVVLDLVISDLTNRAAAGVRKYGTMLKTNNGRDALIDAYQEVLDLAMYIRQEMEERSSRSCATCGEPSDCRIWEIANETVKEGKDFVCGFWRHETGKRIS